MLSSGKNIGRSIHRFATFLSLLSCLNLVLAPIAEGAVGGSSVGILRVGTLLSQSEETAYRLIEKKLGRWFDKEGIASSQLGTSMTVELVGLQSERSRLLLNVDRLWSLMSGREGSRELTEDIGTVYKKVYEARNQLQRYPGLGPSIQRALIAESFYQLQNDRPKAAFSLAQRAFSAHPFLEIEKEIPVQNPVFDKLLEKASRQKRVCELELSVFPSHSTVTVNGFNVGSNRVFQLSGSGNQYAIGVESEGYQGFDRTLLCDRQERRKLIIRLNKDDVAWRGQTLALSQIAEKYGVGSLLLIYPDKSDFEFFLYTPGKAVRRVPLSKPVRVAELIENPMAVRVPIASDAFRKILNSGSEMTWQESRLSSDGKSGLPSTKSFSSSVGSSVGTTTAEIVEPKAWYERWSTWAIAGGVVLGFILVKNRSKTVDATGQPQQNGAVIRY